MYDYSFTSTDPNGDDVAYYIKWGDGGITDWTAFQSSGAPGYSESNRWFELGSFLIEAKAKDVHGEESNWATLEVTMPRNLLLFNTLIQHLLEKHPNILPILQLLIYLR